MRHSRWTRAPLLVHQLRTTLLTDVTITSGSRHADLHSQNLRDNEGPPVAPSNPNANVCHFTERRNACKSTSCRTVIVRLKSPSLTAHRPVALAPFSLQRYCRMEYRQPRNSRSPSIAGLGLRCGLDQPSSSTRVTTITPMPPTKAAKWIRLLRSRRSCFTSGIRSDAAM